MKVSIVIPCYNEEKTLETLVEAVLASELPDREIVAVGYSLGGNMLLKYLGETAEEAVPKAAISVSASIDLAATAECQLDVVHHGAERNLFERQRIANLDVRARTRFNFVANLQTVRSKDVALFTIHIV